MVCYRFIARISIQLLYVCRAAEQQLGGSRDLKRNSFSNRIVWTKVQSDSSAHNRWIRSDKYTKVESNKIAIGFGKWCSASAMLGCLAIGVQESRTGGFSLELLLFVDSPDIGKRGIKEQGRPKSPHPLPHTHLECSSAGRLPKSLLEEQRQVLDDRHFKQQKSLRRPIRITIRMGKD